MLDVTLHQMPMERHTIRRLRATPQPVLIVQWSHPPLLLIHAVTPVPCLPIVLYGLIETTLNCIGVTLGQVS